MTAIMSGAFVVAMGLLLLLLAVHPFVTYPLSLSVLARLRPRPLSPVPSGHAGPEGALDAELVTSAALCVCAFNEERVIEAKARNMLAARRLSPGLELLIYVDAATDRTAELLRPYGDDIRVVVGTTRHGKSHGMNMLVGMTRAELVVFSDANVMFADEAVPELLTPFADPAVGTVCGHLVYVGAHDTATAQTGSIYWRLEERIKALESASGSVMGADGSIFAIRRSLHRPPPADLIDDMFVSLSVLCGGHRVVRAAGAIAYEEGVSRPGEEFRRKVRIACQAFNVHRALWPELRRLPALDLYKYVSHKLLRWMVIYLLAAGGVLVPGGMALAGWPVAALSLLLCGGTAVLLVAAAPARKLAALRDVLAAFVATGLGLARSLRGDRFQTWTPPASSREPAL